MATPGWYPDPAGQPGAFRYWDGQAWGSVTSPAPYAGPQTPTTPQPPATPAYQSYATHPAASYQQPLMQPPQHDWAPTPVQKAGSGRTVGLVLLAVLVTLALGVATFFVVRPLVDDDAASDGASDSAPSSSPTAASSGDPTEGSTEPPSGAPEDPFTDDRTPTARECSGGTPRLGSTPITGGEQTGGGLSMPAPAGFSDVGGLDQSSSFVFATGVSAPSKVVAEGWVAVHALGALTRDNGFDSTGQAAADVLECMTLSSSFYRSFTGAEVTGSAAVEVDGHPGWLIEAEIKVDDPETDIEGDVAQVVVVDTGDLDTYGVLVSLVAIGEQDLLAQQKELLDGLTVD